MRRLLLLILLISLQSTSLAEQVRYVIDGDTFIMADESRVRLAGIDAPELSQPYGPESRAYLDKLVSGQDVTLQCNGEMSYNRRICNAFVNGLDLQRDLVGWGLAFDYAQYSHGAYQPAEDFAYRMKRGVWSGGMRPWEYRKLKKATW